MIDKRPQYTMEQHYCYSDFDFYKNREGTSEVGRVLFDQISRGAGFDLWVVLDKYTMKGKWSSNTIFVMQRLVDGLQIETGGYGWRNVPTQHEEDLKDRKDYEKFLTALQEAGKLCPNGASRWFNEAVLENFEHTFEEILYYGDEDD